MIVFSLNTIIGFACAIGVDMGFNTTHHHDEKVTEVSIHIHADGKKHVHHKKAHHHDEAANHHKSKDGKDNCCNDNVSLFSQLDKCVPQSLQSLVAPQFFISFINFFYCYDVLFASQQTRSIKYFVRSHHPPIPDIRIAIQSFQI